MAIIERKHASNQGFTLSELLIATAIFALALCGILLLFINCIFLNETNRCTYLAFSALQAKMEEIKNTSFGTLDSSNNASFNLNGFPLNSATGRITVSSVAGSTTRLKRVTITACFMARNRLIGNDLNNCQSSPVILNTLIAE